MQLPVLHLQLQFTVEGFAAARVVTESNLPASLRWNGNGLFALNHQSSMFVGDVFLVVDVEVVEVVVVVLARIDKSNSHIDRTGIVQHKSLLTL